MKMFSGCAGNEYMKGKVGVALVEEKATENQLRLYEYILILFYSVV